MLTLAYPRPTQAAVTRVLKRVAPKTTSEMLTFIESKIPDVLQRKDRIESVRSADQVSSFKAIAIVYKQLGGK